MRDLLDRLDALLERADKDLKTQAIDAVRGTDDERLLRKVIVTLQAGDIEDRIEKTLSQDPDAKKFVTKIAEIVVRISAPIEEKNQFLERYSKGILDTTKLLDGSLHSFSDLVGAGFNTELFTALSVALTSQGVGPGEVALAVMSPKVSWSGRASGGGDINVGDKAVEVKTTVASGGRWINARKATMDMASIEKTLTDAITKSTGKRPESAMPSRISVSNWVNNIRPLIDSKLLPAVTKTMADALFNHTNNEQYQQALQSGSAEDIKDTILDVGFANYKAYSGFDGILLMDVPSQTAQYFRDYDSMRGRIKSETPYVYAPESEAMPKVGLAAGGSGAGGPDAGGAKPVAAKGTARAATDQDRDFEPPRSRVTARGGGVEPQQPQGDRATYGRTRRK